MKCSAVPEETPEGDVTQFFHMLDAVAMPKGAVLVQDGKADYTVYSCCCDIMRGVYYYKTYENNRITAIDLHGADLSGDTLKGYPMDRTPDIRYVT